MNQPNLPERVQTASCTICGHQIVYGPHDSVPDEPVCANH